jgi:hypothetical protein
MFNPLAVSITFPDVVIGVLVMEAVALIIGVVHMWSDGRLIQERIANNKAENAAEHEAIKDVLTLQAGKLTTIRDNHLPHIYEALTRLEVQTSAIKETVDRIANKS